MRTSFGRELVRSQRMASAMESRAVRLKGWEPLFVATVADFFHAVNNAPRAKANAAIGANEFGPAGNRIHFHLRSFRFPHLFRPPLAAHPQTPPIKRRLREKTNQVFARNRRAQKPQRENLYKLASDGH